MVFSIRLLPSILGGVNDGTIKNQHLIVLDLAMVPKQSSEENRWQTRSTREKSAFVRC